MNSFPGLTRGGWSLRRKGAPVGHRLVPHPSTNPSVACVPHVSACICVSAPHCQPPLSIWSAVTQGDGGALHGADTSSHIDDNPPRHNKLNVSSSSICKTRQIMNYCYSGLFTPFPSDAPVHICAPFLFVASLLSPSI